jgi:hypothetical protein
MSIFQVAQDSRQRPRDSESDRITLEDLKYLVSYIEAQKRLENISTDTADFLYRILFSMFMGPIAAERLTKALEKVDSKLADLEERVYQTISLSQGGR